jgi:FkbM family methyltransferase
LAKNSGVKKINLVGVEADPIKFKWLSDNLKANKLKTASKRINTYLHNAAISAKETKLYFPEIKDSSQDYGNAAVKKVEPLDYRGMDFALKEVKAIPLNFLLKNHSSKVDVLFVDIQGSEFDVLQSAIEQLNEKVKVVIIGTHSRKIEGDLLNLLYENNWHLEKEEPCGFEYDLGAASLAGMTNQDGCQIWVNTFEKMPVPKKTIYHLLKDKFLAALHPATG